MTRFRAFSTLAFLAAVLVTTLFARAGQAADVSLDGQAQQRLGLSFQRLAPAHQAGEVDAFAKVLDPEPLVQLVSDLETAEAAASRLGPRRSGRRPSIQTRGAWRPRTWRRRWPRRGLMP